MTQATEVQIDDSQAEPKEEGQVDEDLTGSGSLKQKHLYICSEFCSGNHSERETYPSYSNHLKMPNTFKAPISITTQDHEKEKLDLATEEGVRRYLAKTPFESADVTPLSGGVANYVFRLHLLAPYRGSKTLVFKHAKPYVKSMRTVAFNLERQVRLMLLVHERTRVCFGRRLD